MRLIDWNVQWGRDADGVVDLARTIAAARRLGDFDVLCMQEVTRGFGALPGQPGPDQFTELAALLPGYTIFEAIGADLPPLEPDAARRQFGNAIATRLPVGRVLRQLLPWPADASGPSMPRVALEVELTTPSGALRIITTHLEFYSARQRLAQVDAMRARHREACAHADQPAPAENATGPFTATGQARDAIICGDFNSAFDSDAYRRLLEPIADAPSFVDAWVARHAGHTPPPTAGVYDTAQWSDGPLACDFVFVTDTLLPRVTRCEIDGDVRASDHQPVVLEVEVD
ncbi:endonuclease/Exonuclease/phosphatase family protein [Burkholderia ambifaria AMMD]|uniref:Endonuclease/exonuclease/phosphatase n=1 Tax=Burkholderia ambifaria (strain ATCC BAA-244 / DSM 16087 / CCUG 44356 / LMG 19182 / AMMD) TaxID=339670 RepID=Q0BEW1_BURCM|nr:endonuclease/exonuclease/phosphatase family protein [Burkholderia ambifaria]ABI87312.1 Endonuclease/exonuclease/phosphatase [Burkholderia ambifaria AMMD]AJY23261.1 endonuclease/Exonuclease/phosphatase family protein [Burkholderia ambifaria AMMD]MBR7928802.1 endonuclease/exonuclease/phosphatase family protein [Burkholderia ambifaria]PEH65475.1 endonuclease [Burkholderia ambifaria]QQC05473.1 endonuclease/exonuclease/phosphatase family protein [Burkholderia ambifaria]